MYHMEDSPVSETTELFDAIKRGDQKAVTALLDRDANLLSARAENGDSPLLTAIYYREPGIAALLIGRGAVPTVFEVAALGDTARLNTLLDQDPTLLGAYSHDGWTALHLAAHFGRTDAARALLDRGANVTARSRNPLDNIPLHAALAGGDNVALVTLLLEHGSDANTRQHGGYTPLHEAAQNGALGAARALLASGADVCAVTDKGETPLALALAQCHAEVADLLRQYGASESAQA